VSNTIDQTEGILIFQNDDDALLNWDDRTREVCGELLDHVELLLAPTAEAGRDGK